MSAAVALQRLLMARLSAAPALSSVAIVDRAGTPETFPSVLIGEAQEIVESLTFARNVVTVVATLHVWTRTPGTIEAKRIADAIRAALIGELPPLQGRSLIDLRYRGARYMRDPDGKTTHGVVTVEAMSEETP